jgi:hypothetical protein
VSIDEEAIWEKINLAEGRMTMPQNRLWSVIRIMPEKWREPTYGSESGGFWVVAIIGSTAIWYNEIEHGFCRSRFAEYGEIAEFKWNDSELGDALQYVLDEISTGLSNEPWVSPPQAGEYPAGR